MKNFQQHRGYKSILHSRPVLFLLSCLVLFFAWGVIRFMIKMETTIENRKIAENKLIELKKEKDKLSIDIEKLKTSEGVEESIREKFGLVKDGEGVIVVVEDKTNTQVKVNNSENFFQKFLNYFK